MKHNLLQILGIATVFLASCSTTPPQPSPSAEVIETKISASHAERPEWLTNTPDDDASFSYLAGMSQKMTDEQAATDSAAVHATSSFVKSCGVRVSLRDIQVREAKGQSTAGPIELIVTGKSTDKQRSNAFVSGLKIKERYTEKWEVRQGGIKLKNSYFIALLFSVPKDECSRIKEWWKNYIARFEKGLEQMIDEARSFAGKGEWESALNTMIEAENRVAENNIDPGEINYSYSMIRTLKANYQDKLIIRRIEDSSRQSAEFAENGNLTAAFKLLNNTRAVIVESIPDQVKQKRYLTTIQSREDELITRISLSAVGNTNLQIEPGKKPDVLAVQLVYQLKNNRQKAIANVPIRFAGKTSHVSIKTDADGKAELRMTAAPEKGDLPIRAGIDTAEWSGAASPQALAGLSAKEVNFLIRVKSALAGLDEIEKQDFLFKISTDNEAGTYKVGDTITVNTQCGARCYLKIFNIDDHGEVTVLLDTQSSRLLKNDHNSFQVKAVAPGIQSLVAIASTKPFPLNFKANETIDSNSFPLIYKKLKLSANAKAEDRVTMNIIE
jgi:hypothetical protein